MSRECIIYADESSRRGKFFSNFYGGLLVPSQHLADVESTLHEVKTTQNLGHEVKWQRVTEQYLSKYIAVIDAVFDLLAADKAKIRIMFTRNSAEPIGLSSEQRDDEYFLLYYQFIKHSFGLKYANDGKVPMRVRIYLDRLPDTREKNERFKLFLHALEANPEFKRANILIPADQIAEVDSDKHVAMQAIDIVLGAIHFRLNDLHKAIPDGQRKRGKRTVAKETLYKHINRRISVLYPNFNVGVSTGVGADIKNRWLHPYRHWCFEPAISRWKPDATKSK